jgi:hypothetical protein
MINEYAAVGGIKIGRGNIKTQNALKQNDVNNDLMTIINTSLL